MDAINGDDAPSYMSYFRSKTIFLTGATGNLGSCTVYKLVTQLHVKKIYLLVRGSKERAIGRWRRKLGSYANHLSLSDKIQFIVGDMVLPQFGMSPAELRALQDETNIIIHAAANISLLDSISKTTSNNCDPVLEIAKLSAQFKSLERLVHISTAYVSSFLPDGLVREKLYQLMDDDTGDEVDPELELQEIHRTGYSIYTKQFGWPYAFSKYLAERLLFERYSSLPLLVIRPSIIGPAFRVPFPLFGEEESFPISQTLKVYFRKPEASRLWHQSSNPAIPGGENTIDEIPVDWVANILLLHIAAQSRGIIHAAAGNYVKRTANIVLGLMGTKTKDALAEIPPQQWIPVSSGPQCALANFVAVGNRDWNFSCQKSAGFKQVRGPLSIDLAPDEVPAFHDNRLNVMIDEVRQEASGEASVP